MSHRLKSYIKVINKKKRWGYIEKIDLDHTRDYAFYSGSLSKMSSVTFDELSTSMEVSFTLEETDGLFTAKDVEVVEGSNQEEVTAVPVSTAKNKDESVENYLLGKEHINDSDLVIGIVSAVGTQSADVISTLNTLLQRKFGYVPKKIKISEIMNRSNKVNTSNEEERITGFIKIGNDHRKEGGNAILAAGAVKEINSEREKDKKMVFIIDSLKHPEEVEFLRRVYGHGFYLLGIHADEERRLNYLSNIQGCARSAAEKLIKTDENEGFRYGQKTRSTFHLADFFLNLGTDLEIIKNTLDRFLDLIFSNPYLNPTFDEFAMFMAFNSSVRSGDLSRQVGAVMANNQQILATGANDVPKFGGGLYWAEDIDESGQIADVPFGKDSQRGFDSNKHMQRQMVSEILESIKFKKDEIKLTEDEEIELEKILLKSKISDLTEFGRVVHAEMEAILSCSREGIPTSNTTLYCTTFPCHNCAKHIIASGIIRVVYVEPYPKSKALDFHNDSISLKLMDSSTPTDKVVFEPFIGVGPRRFLDLFSMSLGAGSKLKRKDDNGNVIAWDSKQSSIRTPLVNKSYIDLEMSAIDIWEKHLEVSTKV